MYWTDDDGWVNSLELPSGMTAFMSFFEMSPKTWNICIGVFNTFSEYRDIDSFESAGMTGKDGLIPASFFLETLKEAEEKLSTGDKNSRLEASALDKRRWAIYKRLLIPRGYEIEYEWDEEYQEPILYKMV